MNFGNFRALFENLIHNNHDLKNVQKLYYLKQALVGPAEDLIRDFELNDQAYPEAWAYLINRYDNKRAIVRLLFRKLRDLEQLKSESSIRSLIDKADVIIRGLKTAGEEVNDTFSRYIAFHVSSKLDAVTAKDWENSLTNSKSFPTYVELHKFLQNRSFAIDEAVADVKIQDKAKFGQNGAKKSFHASSPTPVSCMCCNGQHKLFECSKFKALSTIERFKFIKGKNLCILCFSERYRASSCNKSKCKLCDGLHNTLLHFENRTFAVENRSPVVESSLKT